MSLRPEPYNSFSHGDIEPYSIRRIAVIFAACLIQYALLCYFREFDDNRLTSWLWVFDIVNPYSVYLGVLASAVLAIPALKLKPLSPKALMLIAFTVSAIFWQVPEVILDSSRYFTYAKDVAMYGDRFFISHWGGTIDAWTDMPLVPYIYGLVFKYLGETRLYVQIVISVMFALTVYLTSLIGMDMLGEEAGSSGGVFLLAMPYLYSQVPLMLVDVPSTFFLVLSIFTFNRALKKGCARWLISAGLSAAACALTKYSMWVMLTTLPVIIVIEAAGCRDKDRERLLVRGLSVFAVAAAAAGAYFIYKYDSVLDQIIFLVDYQSPGLKRWFESYTSTFLFQVHPFVTMLAVAATILAVRRRKWTMLAVAWPIIIIFALGVKRSRYTIPALPSLSLMATYGLTAIRSAPERRYITSVAVLSSIAITVFGFVPFLNTNSMVNLLYAGNYLNDMKISAVRVVTSTQESVVNPAVAVPILDLYTDSDIEYDYVRKETLDDEDISKSSLRFTWNYVNPKYYQKALRIHSPLVVIAQSIEAAGTVSEGRKLLQRFEYYEGVFRFRPSVFIYQ